MDVDAASSSSFAVDATTPFNSDFSVASCVMCMLVLVIATFDKSTDQSKSPFFVHTMASYLKCRNTCKRVQWSESQDPGQLSGRRK